MDSYVRSFIRASLCWLGVGVLMGTALAFWPQFVIYRPAHVHSGLLGFVSMMIFGVAYHVLPRFAGTPLHRPRLALMHVWLANIGLIALMGGWLSRPHAASLAGFLLPAGAIASAVGTTLFIYNIWRTLDAAGAGLSVLAARPRS